MYFCCKETFFKGFVIGGVWEEGVLLTCRVVTGRLQTIGGKASSPQYQPFSLWGRLSTMFTLGWLIRSELNYLY